jgi:ribosome production factor 2
MELKRAPRTKAGKRALERRAPKLEEYPKRLLVLRASKASQTAIDGARALAGIKKPLVTLLNRKNELRPFDVGGDASLEFLLQRSDCSLFALATHQKKRPHGLILGRAYNGRILDMIELGIESLETANRIAGASTSLVSVGTKPCLCFLGEAWATEPNGRRLRNFFLDFFRAYDLDSVNLAGVDRAIVLVAAAIPETGLDSIEPNGLGNLRIVLRHYALQLKRRRDGDVRMPLVRLVPSFPSMEWRLRRTRFASEALMRQTMPTTEQLRAAAGAALPKPEKNVKYDPSRLSKVGKVYLPPQDLKELTLSTSVPSRERRDARSTSLSRRETIDATTL